MWFRVLLAGTFAGLLSACAVIDPVDSRYDTVGRSLARARDEAIFLNLVRASHDYPLSFTTVSNVTPSLTNTSSFGLPAFLLGPIAQFSTTAQAVQSLPSSSPGRDIIFGNSTASNATAISTNFSVSTQETSAFYEGFLKPIDLTTLAYFIRQGYPREILFWLFTDYFEVKANGQTLGYRFTPPDDYGCPPQRDSISRCFTDWVRIATLAGLTVEQKTLQKSSSGGQKGGGSDAAGGTSKPSTTVFSRFCFSDVLAQQARDAMGGAMAEVVQKTRVRLTTLGRQVAFDRGQSCGSKTWNPLSTLNEPQSDVFEFTVGGASFKIVPRSAYGVFEFLGNLMKMQRRIAEADPSLPEPAPYLIPPDRDDVRELPPALKSVHDDANLVTVIRNGGDGGNGGSGGPPGCFSHTWFYDGDYCVPQYATTTKRIFGLLAQLIAIQTAASDLSITPIVRVIQ
ncbi:MAG: hypothetical protein WBF03_22770 [Xanthobacteraceae bacterium]